MNVHIITAHPQYFKSYESFGVFRAAKEKKLATIEAIDLRKFAVDKHGSIDAKSYGGGDGMVLRPEPLAGAVGSLENPYVILMSPRGKVWEQKDVSRLLEIKRPLAFVCGRFGGVDERFVEQHVDEEISLGNFIMSGGELPALCIVDSLLRHIPGVLGNEESAEIESFSEKISGRIEHPLYTKPQIFNGLEVPPVLRSGNHSEIQKWREEESQRLSKKYKPELFSKDELHSS